MPELPEVETVVRGLKRTISGLTIERVTVRETASVYPQHKKFASLFKGAVINDVARRGKNILIHLSTGYTLWVHLKMTGHFNFLPVDVPATKHDHVVFRFQGQSNTLRFNDYRRFGRLRLYPTENIMSQKGLAELGPEPLEITADEFARRLRARNRMIKPALLDQTFLAGVGNIYADESLYLARIHPRRSTASISLAKAQELHGHIQTILRRAIRLMGTSVDTFIGLNGEPGGFQKYLRVYGREGEPCPRCGAAIIRKTIGGRSAHFCPRCQRPK
ncbi:MAG: bifunctional DNA-formamidopyrimidine glycosylase/DNA-(apurinic or apyrimidinic site) lyase [candidate division Zixibacteria bacterium]|nr:bifunctional DNA-formamidopyrimidine glycosylase/DNA-(apurinic or apyrimidinic site) lyase [candidate division Zixibacteria bacterium]